MISTNTAAYSEQPELLHGYVQQPEYVYGLWRSVLLVLQCVCSLHLTVACLNNVSLIREQLPELLRLCLR